MSEVNIVCLSGKVALNMSWGFVESVGLQTTNLKQCSSCQEIDSLPLIGVAGHKLT